MRALAHLFKPTVTSVLLAVGFSIPTGVAAQESTVDELLDQLREAEPGRDGRILSQIFTEWEKSGSPAIDLLLRRGRDALERRDIEAALDHLSAAIDHAPDFAEAYHARASVFYEAGMIGPALDDLRQTLVLNPRHFRAMQGVAVILGELGMAEESLEIFRLVQEMHPADPDVAAMIEGLSAQLEGQTL